MARLAVSLELLGKLLQLPDGYRVLGVISHDHGRILVELDGPGLPDAQVRLIYQGALRQTGPELRCTGWERVDQDHLPEA